jgi:hypothetical protein
MNFIFQRIPIVIYKEIQSFLVEKEYYKLLSSSKEVFDEISKETRKITIGLWENELENFLEDEEYQIYVFSKMKNPELQLCLSVNISPITAELLQKLQRIQTYSLFLAFAQNLEESSLLWNEVLCHRRILSLRNNSNVTKLDIHHIDQLEVYRFDKFKFVGNLYNLKELNLCYCGRLSDVSPLKNIERLSIIYCPKVVDVSMLGSVRELTLKFCDSIRDISNLRNNYRLTVLNCYRIHKLKAIDDPYLSLYYPVHLVTDLVKDDYIAKSLDNPRTMSITLVDYNESSIFRKNPLQSLTLLSASSITLPWPTILYSVHLETCDFLTNINGLESVPVIELILCPELVDITALNNPITCKTRSVWISACNNLQDFSPLKKIANVRIDSCEGCESGGHFDQVKNLTLFQCYKLSDISMLTNVYHLKLFECTGITSLNGLTNVPIITIFCCSSIHSLRGLGNNQKILLSEEYEIYYQQREIEEFDHYQLVERDLLSSKTGMYFVLLRKRI